MNLLNISVNSANKIQKKLPGRVGLTELVLAELTGNHIFFGLAYIPANEYLSLAKMPATALG